jgi:hypothetical protein
MFPVDVPLRPSHDPQKVLQQLKMEKGHWGSYDLLVVFFTWFISGLILYTS